MDTMIYRDFQAHAMFDAEDGLFFGHIADIADIIGFHAESRTALDRAFREAVDDYIAWRPPGPGDHGVSGGSETAASS